MLQDSDVATRLPAQDLERARAFYADKLGLEPIEERPGGLRYQCGSGRFSLFESAGAPSGDYTQMAWEVDDIEAVVRSCGAAALSSRSSTSPAFGRWTASPRWRGTTRRPASASWPPGSGTARGTCSASAKPFVNGRVRRRGLRPLRVATLTSQHQRPQAGPPS